MTEPTLAIGMIVRNEAPYLLDFLSWHRALGFRCFLIADEESDDGTTEILRRLQGRGLLHHLPYRRWTTPKPQLHAYVEMQRRLAGRVAWLAHLDADEFILPDGPERDLPQMLGALPPEVGGVALNWACYGSAGALLARNEATVLRFTRRAPQHQARNLHKKMIVRPEAVAGRAGNPHDIPLRPHFVQVTAQGAPVTLCPDRPGRTAMVDWTGFRLNHYPVRSWAEFEQRKMPRGMGDTVGRRRNLNYFFQHDNNEVEDPVPAWMLDRWRRRRAALLERAGPEAARLMQAAEEGLERLRPSPLPEPDPSWRGENSVEIPPAPSAPRLVRQLHKAWRQRPRLRYRPPLW